MQCLEFPAAGCLVGKQDPAQGPTKQLGAKSVQNCHGETRRVPLPEFCKAEMHMNMQSLLSNDGVLRDGLELLWLTTSPSLRPALFNSRQNSSVAASYSHFSYSVLTYQSHYSRCYKTILESQ